MEDRQSCPCEGMRQGDVRLKNPYVLQKNLFKAGKGKRPSGTSDYALNVQDSGDLSYFFSPNIVSGGRGLLCPVW